MIKDNVVFREAYERALQHRADRLAEEILELFRFNPKEEELVAPPTPPAPVPVPIDGRYAKKSYNTTY